MDAAKRIYAPISDAYEYIQAQVRSITETADLKIAYILLHGLAGLCMRLAGQCRGMLPEGNTFRTTKVGRDARTRIKATTARLAALDVSNRHQYRTLATSAHHASMEAWIWPSEQTHNAARQAHIAAAEHFTNDQRLARAGVDVAADLEAHEKAAAHHSRQEHCTNDHRLARAGVDIAARSQAHETAAAHHLRYTYDDEADAEHELET